MKLAEVSAANNQQHQPWENSNNDQDGLQMSPAPTDAGDLTNGGGHKNGDDAAKSNNGTHEGEEAANEDGSNTELLLPGQQPPAQEAAEKLDPVVEVCKDLQVKIADLGNACWVVSG